MSWVALPYSLFPLGSTEVLVKWYLINAASSGRAQSYSISKYKFRAHAHRASVLFSPMV